MYRDLRRFRALFRQGLDTKARGFRSNVGQMPRRSSVSGKSLPSEPLRFSFVTCVTQTYVFTLTGFRPTPPSPRFAANCGHVRAAGSERLDHREPQPLAAAGDDHAFSVQILPASSPSSVHQAWWL